MLGLVVSGWQGASAAFTSRTSSAGSAWTTGTVVLTNNPATALFAVTGLQPGASGTNCVDVTYAGSLAAIVKVYGSVSPSGAGTLSTYLQITVEEGSGTCSSFTPPGSPGFTGTAAAFASTYPGYASGLGSWAVTGSGGTHPFRISYQLLADNGAQSLSGSVSLTWEARNS